MFYNISLSKKYFMKSLCSIIGCVNFMGNRSLSCLLLFEKTTSRLFPVLTLILHLLRYFSYEGIWWWILLPPGGLRATGLKSRIVGEERVFIIREWRDLAHIGVITLFHTDSLSVVILTRNALPLRYESIILINAVGNLCLIILYIIII